MDGIPISVAGGITATPDNIDGKIDNRGFTGHEMLDALDLVHMNGRIYEPMLGRFMSADPLIQDPMNGQNYAAQQVPLRDNRYAYVLNNPTNLTDPTGFACEKTTGSNICDTTQATTLASGNYKYEGANGKMHYVVNHKEVDGTTGKPIAAPATKSDNLLKQASAKDGGACYANNTNGSTGTIGPQTQNDFKDTFGGGMIAGTLGKVAAAFTENNRNPLTNDYENFAGDNGIVAAATVASNVIPLGRAGNTVGAVGKAAVPAIGSALAKAGEVLSLAAPKIIHDHHLLPQQFKSFFASRGIDINAHTITLGSQSHLTGMHGKGLGNMPGNWNHNWSDWIAKNPAATVQAGVRP